MVERTERKIRILVAKLGMDTHDRGALLLCQLLRDAGMEVIYTGYFQTPESVVRSAVSEDINAICLSLLDDSYMFLVPKLMDILKKKGIDDISVIAGGIISDEYKPVLENIGVTGNFGPGTSFKTIIDHILERVKTSSVDAQEKKG
ncbi:MAG: cobalamin B12-binding domain-containing protein [Pseudomonadota bacterium]